MPSFASPMVPAIVSVRCPICNTQGFADQDSYYEVRVNIGDVMEAAPFVGAPGVKIMHDTAGLALVQAGQYGNLDQITCLANRMAADYYGWRLISYDRSFNSVIAPAADASIDMLRIDYNIDRCVSRMTSRPLNNSWPEEFYHWSFECEPQAPAPYSFTAYGGKIVAVNAMPGAPSFVNEARNLNIPKILLSLTPGQDSSITGAGVDTVALCCQCPVCFTYTTTCSDPSPLGHVATVTRDGVFHGRCTIVNRITALTIGSPGHYTGQATITIPGNASAKIIMGGGSLSMTVAKAGEGYHIPPDVFISGTGTDAIFTVALGIVGFRVISPGSGYTDGTGYQLKIVGCSILAQDQAAGTYDVMDGGVANPQVTTAGTNYRCLPIVLPDADAGDGCGATIEAILGVVAVQAISSGTRYAAGTTATVIDPTGYGHGAALAVTVSDLGLGQAILLDGGSVYDPAHPPVPVITGPGAGGGSVSATVAPECCLDLPPLPKGKHYTVTMPGPCDSGSADFMCPHGDPIALTSDTLHVMVNFINGACRAFPQTLQAICTGPDGFSSTVILPPGAEPWAGVGFCVPKPGDYTIQLIDLSNNCHIFTPDTVHVSIGGCGTQSTTSTYESDMTGSINLSYPGTCGCPSATYSYSGIDGSGSGSGTISPGGTVTVGSLQAGCDYLFSWNCSCICFGPGTSTIRASCRPSPTDTHGPNLSAGVHCSCCGNDVYPDTTFTFTDSNGSISFTPSAPGPTGTCFVAGLLSGAMGRICSGVGGTGSQICEHPIVPAAALIATSYPVFSCIQGSPSVWTLSQQTSCCGDPVTGALFPTSGSCGTAPLPTVPRSLPAGCQVPCSANAANLTATTDCGPLNLIFNIAGGVNPTPVFVTSS